MGTSKDPAKFVGEEIPRNLAGLMDRLFENVNFCSSSLSPDQPMSRALN